MENRILNYLFWFFLLATVLTLILNAGLFFAVSLIIIVPLLILHTKIGLKINKLEKYKLLIIISMLNLFLFSLLRPDGVHSFNQIGIESLSDFFGFYVRVNQRFENYYFNISLVLIAIQLILDIILLVKSNKSEID